jgi:hypothetical protein
MAKNSNNEIKGCKKCRAEPKGDTSQQEISYFDISFGARDARFFSLQHTKTGENRYRMAEKYTKRP